MMKKAFVTGITGQDGSYLAELLLENGYEVHGLQRPSSLINTGRIDHIYERLHMHYGDMTDRESLEKVIKSVEPDEIYNLAGQSHVRISFDMPKYTQAVNADGFIRIQSILLQEYGMKATRLYQASSSEMFGNSDVDLQDEKTPFRYCSPYGHSKVIACRYAQEWRKAGCFHINGILFNHTSERQKETFVTRKITKAAVRIKLGLQKEFYLGNLDAKRDIGHARDYVRAIWLMMQQDNPDDFVIATGEQYSVKDILDEAFGYLNLDWRDYVKIDPRLYRPAELHSLCGDATKAREVLGWRPTITFSEIVYGMVDAEMKAHKTAAPSYASLFI